LTLRPEGVRRKLIGNYTENYYLTSGAAGNATQAAPEYGRKLLSLKVEAAVEQIRNAQIQR
jgi:hypothetical protein